MRERNAETSETTILNPNAHQKLSTVNPGTKFVVNKTSKALITSVKSPSVSTLIGNVKRSKTGLMNALITPSTIETINAVTRESKCTPGRI